MDAMQAAETLEQAAAHPEMPESQVPAAPSMASVANDPSILHQLNIAAEIATAGGGMGAGDAYLQKYFNLMSDIVDTLTENTPHA